MAILTFGAASAAEDVSVDDSAVLDNINLDADSDIAIDDLSTDVETTDNSDNAINEEIEDTRTMEYLQDVLCYIFDTEPANAFNPPSDEDVSIYSVLLAFVEELYCALLGSGWRYAPVGWCVCA